MTFPRHSFRLFAPSSVIAMLLPLLPLSPGLSRAARAADTQHDVVIVGAGVSGLYAAYTLNNLGFDVLVLEANDRRGGRVFSSTGINPDFWVAVSELGAEEVESSSGNFIQDDINAAFPGRLGEIFTYDNNGKVVFVSPWQAEDTVLYPGDGNAQEIYDYWDFYYHREDGEAHLAGESMLEDLANNHGVTPTSDDFHLYLVSPGAIYQARLGDLDMRSFGRQEQLWPYGNDFSEGFLVSGYLPTLDELYFNEINHLVQLNSTVTEINTAGPVPYALVGSDKHFAPAIIVTVSAGVINAGSITFTPALSTAKLAAYGTLNMGPGFRGAKAIMKWNAPFWPRQVEYVLTDGAGSQCWNQGKHKNITASQKRVWACLIAPDAYDLYLADLADDQARLEAVAADFLTVFTGGTIEDNFEGGYFTNYGEDPKFLGAYSSPNEGSYPETGPDMRQVAAAQIGTSLYFAGEATNSAGPAVVIGAAETGERAALEVDADHDPAPVPEPGTAV